MVDTENVLTNMEAENPTKQHAKKCPKLYGQDCTCDGYHTFKELYDHRIALFIALANFLSIAYDEYGSGLKVWKSKIHHDGTSLDGWFIAGIGEKKGEQISYHLPLDKWDELLVDFIDKAPEFDGHTSDDVLERLKKL